MKKMSKMNQKFIEEYGSGFTKDIEDFLDDDLLSPCVFAANDAIGLSSSPSVSLIFWGVFFILFIANIKVQFRKRRIQKKI